MDMTTSPKINLLDFASIDNADAARSQAAARAHLALDAGPFSIPDLGLLRSLFMPSIECARA